MNAVFLMMMLAGVLCAAWQGNLAAAQAALLSGGGEAVSFCLNMAGAYAFFGGLLCVARESGMTAALAAAMKKPLGRLFRFRPGEECAMDEICVNLAADLLGMGGAATPAGIAAMKKMAGTGGRAQASEAMTLFLVLNMCSMQLLPTTMIALRAQAGAENPADIVLPTLICTGASALTGIALCKIIEKRSKTHA